MRDLDDRGLYGNVMNTLGNVHVELGNLDAARACFEESIACFSEDADPLYRTLSAAMISVATVVLDLGDCEEAQALASRALAGCEQTGNRRLAALSLGVLGGIALARGDTAAAGEHLRASISAQHELGDVAGIGQVLERFVELAAAQGRPDEALRLAGASAALRDRLGAPLTPSSRARLERALEPVRPALSADAADAAWEAGHALDLSQVVDAALAITEAPAATPVAAASPAPGRGAASTLSRREQEVAVLIARGLTNRQIADALVITEGTAASHVVHILNKLGFRSRAQVAVWATENGLAATPPQS